jgi:hypothetical protein
VATEKGTYCRFCLVGEDQTEEDEQGGYRIIVQCIPFVATHLIGAAIGPPPADEMVSSVTPSPPVDSAGEEVAVAR